MIIRPIHVMRESGVSDLKYSYVLTATRAFVDFMGAGQILSVLESSGSAETSLDLNLLLALARIPGKPANCTNVGLLDGLVVKLSARRHRAWNGVKRPYLVTVVDRKLRWRKAEKWLRLVGYYGDRGHLIVSVRDPDYESETSAEERIKSTTLHELGHMFCPETPSGPPLVDDGYGGHCANCWCMMKSDDLPRLGLTGELLDRRLLLRFCNRCRYDIYTRFQRRQV